MMCLLPVGSSLSSLAMTVTAKRTLPSVRIASLSPAFLCNLQRQWDKEIQDPKIQGQPKGFTAVSFPSETDSTSPSSCFPPKLWFFSESKRLSCCTSLVWGHKEVFACSPTAMVCGCTWANVSKNGSDLLTFITSAGQKLSALGDTDYNALTSFSHQRADFSLFSSRNTTWQGDAISKARLSTRVFMSLPCPCYSIE